MDQNDNSDSNIDDSALAIATKGDSNGINNMITDLYKKKSNLKPNEAPSVSDSDIANINMIKKVTFNSNNIDLANNNKRKSMPGNNDVHNSKSLKTENMTNMEKLELLKQSQRKTTNSSSKKGVIIKKNIRFFVL